MRVNGEMIELLSERFRPQAHRLARLPYNQLTIRVENKQVLIIGRGVPFQFFK
jgi:hypothetical protein